MKSKTKISKQLQRKLNPELVETIKIAKKHEKWLKVASILSGPRRIKIAINLDKINKESEAGDIIVVPGKVLSMGNVDKKIKVVALGFSGKTKEKLKKAGCQTLTILGEIKENPKGEGIKVLNDIEK